MGVVFLGEPFSGGFKRDPNGSHRFWGVPGLIHTHIHLQASPITSRETRGEISGRLAAAVAGWAEAKNSRSAGMQSTGCLNVYKRLEQGSKEWVGINPPMYRMSTKPIPAFAQQTSHVLDLILTNI